MIRGLMITVRRVMAGDMTVKQAFVYSKMRLFNTQKDLNDDFDWTQYHSHYREELKIVGRTATLLPTPGDFVFSGNTLQQINQKIKPLHPNHHLLYETVLQLAPSNVLEIGCGGGDHLRNLHLLAPSIQLSGVDRSQEQLNTLHERHPDLVADLRIIDITEAASELPAADLIYSQTVLMHISETQGRLLNALRAALKSARRQIVMVEDWTEHDFLAHVRAAISGDPAWADAAIYWTSRPAHPDVRAMVVSKTPLAYPVLRNYDELLQGRTLQIH